MPTKTKPSAKKVETLATGTPRNPGNEGSYAVESIKPHPDSSKSRFTTFSRNFEGWNTPARGEAMAAAFDELVRARRQATPELAPEPKTLDLWFISRNQSGEIVRVPRGTVRRIPTLETTRTGRFAKVSETGGALLDRVMIENPMPDVRDEAIYDALEACIEAEGITDPTVLRSLNDQIAILICLRAGLALEHSSELPAIGAPHQR